MTHGYRSRPRWPIFKTTINTYHFVLCADGLQFNESKSMNYIANTRYVWLPLQFDWIELHGIFDIAVRRTSNKNTSFFAVSHWNAHTISIVETTHFDKRWTDYTFVLIITVLPFNCLSVMRFSHMRFELIIINTFAFPIQFVLLHFQLMTQWRIKK